MSCWLLFFDMLVVGVIVYVGLGMADSVNREDHRNASKVDDMVGLV